MSPGMCIVPDQMPLASHPCSANICCMSESSKETNLAMLRWLVDGGADEAMLETSVDRFAIANPKQDAGADTPKPSKGPQTPKIGEISASAKAVSLSTAPGAARELAKSCSTLTMLKSALESFEGCELKRLATNTVFADGNPEGPIMFIGEAPGRDEDLEGRPFVGRAGKLLDMMLGALALDRSNVYITNILPWRPPTNRDPTPEEASICLPFLHRHIELAQPRALVLLGAVSARHLLGISGGIMRARGNWQVYQTQSGAIPAMPTLHPAYLLRQPSAKRLAWRDLLAVAEKIEVLQSE
jgi:uracil-DNA glycosylase family 4